MIVYLITNTVNGKKYVGMTKTSLKVRWQGQQKFAQKGGCTYFCNAIRKHGVQAFHLEVLRECSSKEEAIELEKQFIRVFGTQDQTKGYNLTKGGEGTWGRVSTVQTREKISAARKGKPNPWGADKKGKPGYWRGKFRSEETRYKMSLAKRGAATSGKNNSFFGKTHSEETRRKISEAQKGRRRSLESRLKQAAAMRELRQRKFWSSKGVTDA